MMTATGDEPLKVRVEIGERSYDILIGDGLLSAAGRHLRPILARPSAVVVTDEAVAALHLESVRRSLVEAGIAEQAIVLPAGEATKSFTQLQDLLDRLLALRVERSDTILALGGGVIGDLAGFAAAVLRRGVDFVQLPTTLLAQVDSSVGGKTGINTRHGKNLIGAFHQPRLVLADVSALATLPLRERRAGYAEVAKYGLLGDAGFFAWLEQNGAAVLAGDGVALRHAVMTSCRHKARIVAADERESGVRALLNLGHTFGHALEAEAGYGDALLHGEAVAIGMIMAFELSVRLGLCPAADAARVRRHFRSVGLPTRPADVGLGRTTPERLLDHMRQDKKIHAGHLIYILVHGIGSAFSAGDVDAADVKAMLQQELTA